MYQFYCIKFCQEHLGEQIAEGAPWLSKAHYYFYYYYHYYYYYFREEGRIQKQDFLRLDAVSFFIKTNG